MRVSAPTPRGRRRARRCSPSAPGRRRSCSRRPAPGPAAGRRPREVQRHAESDRGPRRARRWNARRADRLRRSEDLPDRVRRQSLSRTGGSLAPGSREPRRVGGTAGLPGGAIVHARPAQPARRPPDRRGVQGWCTEARRYHPRRCPAGGDGPVPPARQRGPGGWPHTLPAGRGGAPDGAGQRRLCVHPGIAEPVVRSAGRRRRPPASYFQGATSAARSSASLLLEGR